MNVLPKEKQVQIVSALVEGSSIRSIERMTGVHRDTIMRLLVRTGGHCASVLDVTMRDLRCQSLQLDEIWTFVGKKAGRMSWFESLQHPEFGDQYVFVALDADTKLVPCFVVGKRDAASTQAFMQSLRARVPGQTQITTDAFKCYNWAIRTTYGADADYAQVVKVYGAASAGRGRYSPPPVTATQTNVQWGKPDHEKISTSHIERQNLTMRMQMRRFTRLTNGFSKKRENLVAALNLHFAWYNFVRVHRSLRITPAMAAGVTREIWEVDSLIG